MIDRSNPLPIHQFPTLIDKVRELQAHCAQQPGYFAVLEKLLAAAKVMEEHICKSE